MITGISGKKKDLTTQLKIYLIILAPFLHSLNQFHGDGVMLIIIAEQDS